MSVGGHFLFSQLEQVKKESHSSSKLILTHEGQRINANARSWWELSILCEGAERWQVTEPTKGEELGEVGLQHAFYSEQEGWNYAR